VSRPLSSAGRPGDHAAMLQALARRIGNAASWPRVGFLFLAYAGLVAALTAAEGRIKEHSAGLGVPDLLHGFTAAELYARLEAFGPEGRRIYAFAELVDMIYPLVYATFFAFLLALAARRLFAAGSRWAAVCVLPYGAMVSDYLENACFFTVLGAWPARLDAVATLGGVFNLVKWGIFAVTLPLVLVGLAAMGIVALRGSRPG
jgi:hypothetical protein